MSDESTKVFHYARQDYSVTVWKLAPHESEPGCFFIETSGDPALSAEQFAIMAKNVAEAARTSP
jgi:hypothetical protein